MEAYLFLQRNSQPGSFTNHVPDNCCALIVGIPQDCYVFAAEARVPRSPIMKAAFSSNSKSQGKIERGNEFNNLVFMMEDRLIEDDIIGLGDRGSRWLLSRIVQVSSIIY